MALVAAGWWSNINNRGRQGLMSNSGCFWQAGVYGDAGVWALGARQQRIYYPRPLSLRAPPASRVGQVI